MQLRRIHAEQPKKVLIDSITKYKVHELGKRQRGKIKLNNMIGTSTETSTQISKKTNPNHKMNTKCMIHVPSASKLMAFVHKLVTRHFKYSFDIKLQNLD